MTLNVFKYPSCYSKLMIRNMDDARAFYAQCKAPFICFFTKNVWLEVRGGEVTVNQQIDEWVSFESEYGVGEDAVKILYKYRKYINAKFRD